MAIDRPSAGDTITTGWGIDVANALNRIGVGIIHGWSIDHVIQPGSTVILPVEAIEHDARLFLKDDQVVISEGRQGVYVVTAYLMVKGLPDDQWGRAYLYRNGVAIAGSNLVGAGGTSVPVGLSGVALFAEGDSLQVRVNFQSEATVTLLDLSMTRIAENT